MCYCIFFLKRILDILIINDSYETSSTLILNIIKERYLILLIALISIRLCHYILDIILIPNFKMKITKIKKILNDYKLPCIYYEIINGV